MKRQLVHFKLEDGNVYFVKEKTLSLSVSAFKDLLNIGYRGLILSRTSEKEIRKAIEGNYGFLWLAEIPAEMTVSPNFRDIETYLDSLPRRTTVLIDRLEYLISKDGFKETLFFVQRLKEMAYLSRNIFIMCVDAATLNGRELRFLEKETKEVEPLIMTRIPEDMLEILRFVHKQNNFGIKPNHSEVRQGVRVSRPTIAKRITRLRSTGYLIDAEKGSSKVLELTQKGRNLFS